MSTTTRELAKIKSADIAVDGCLAYLLVEFAYEGTGRQRLPNYQLDGSFVLRFIRAVGVESLSAVVGKSCWVTHNFLSISLVEPLHAEDGVAFSLPDWSEWIAKRLPSGLSQSEMATGIDPNEGD